MINIIFNGDQVAVDDMTTLSSLLSNMNIPTVGCAVSINSIIVPKGSWDIACVECNDEISVFNIVAGG
ncbi:sulfur carrier protein ThiS [Vibrio sp. WJH972]